jgi:hypothetical protein
MNNQISENQLDWWDVTRATLRRRGRAISLLAIGAVIGFLLCWVVEGRFYYTKQGATVIRINRITGTAYVLTATGWMAQTPFTEKDFE